MDNQLRPIEARPGVQGNAWISKHWEAKAERLVYMNTRGPECFDFTYYKEVSNILWYFCLCILHAQRCFVWTLTKREP